MCCISMGSLRHGVVLLHHHHLFDRARAFYDVRRTGLFRLSGTSNNWKRAITKPSNNDVTTVINKFVNRQKNEYC